MSVLLPPLPEQQTIAEILDTVDEAIRTTEQVIAKLQQIKQGLLHDLLTRGIDENGELRDSKRHPEHFKNSLVGKIPAKWKVLTIGQVCVSAVDGPFGSSLKSSHYVDSPGVRVIRLQNIGDGEFSDDDRAYISESHALALLRHEVLPGDLLVASLGDDKHLYARACLYPSHLPSAVTKADCFRLRFDPHCALNGFVALALNCNETRRAVRGLAQGVTRDRVNLQNLKAVPLPFPEIEEQKAILERMAALQAAITYEKKERAKLSILKHGLMYDLLTGRVRVEFPQGAAV
jgi:type I restriction enzyme S subunit